MIGSITPGVTWGRSRQPAGGKGKWHLLLEMRRNTSGQYLGGRWGQVPPAGLFAIAFCGQAVNDPDWDFQPDLVPHSWWGMTGAFPVPTTDWCLPCAEAAIRQAGSAPA